MQINFIPHKIKASKAYLTNLVEEEIEEIKSVKKKETPPSFFQKILKLFFK